MMPTVAVCVLNATFFLSADRKEFSSSDIIPRIKSILYCSTWNRRLVAPCHSVKLSLSVITKLDMASSHTTTCSTSRSPMPITVSFWVDLCQLQCLQFPLAIVSRLSSSMQGSSHHGYTSCMHFTKPIAPNMPPCEDGESIRIQSATTTRSSPLACSEQRKPQRPRVAGWTMLDRGSKGHSSKGWSRLDALSRFGQLRWKKTVRRGSR